MIERRHRQPQPQEDGARPLIRTAQTDSHIQRALTGGVTRAEIRSVPCGNGLLNFRSSQVVLKRGEDPVRDGAVGQHPSIRSNNGYACEGFLTEISYS